MALRPKVLTSEHLQGLTRLCPDCGQPIPSTGKMFKEKRGRLWHVGFLCPQHDNLDCWMPELEPFIQKALEGVDINALPYRGEEFLQENLSSPEAQNRAEALRRLQYWPTGDARMRSLAEGLLKDKAPCRISVSSAGGEIRWLAAHALAAARFASGRFEPVRLPGAVAPLVWQKLAALEKTRNEAEEYRDMRPSFTRLRDQGRLPMYEFEFPPIYALSFFEEYGRVLPIDPRYWNERALQRLLKNLQSHSAKDRAEALDDLQRNPTGDARALPLLEGLLEDRTPCNIPFPSDAYVELRWVAAHALASELSESGPHDPVRVPNAVAPLIWHELTALRKAAHIPPPHVDPATGLEDILETFSLLHDRGLLPVYDMEISDERVRPL